MSVYDTHSRQDISKWELALRWSVYKEDAGTSDTGLSIDLNNFCKRNISIPGQGI